MKQEDKELLLQDLCGRLPYGVKMNHIADTENNPIALVGIAKTMITLESPAGYGTSDIEDYIPYLFPLSSMTEEQKKELDKKFLFMGIYGYNIQIYYHSQGHWDRDLEVDFQDWLWLINWLNKNHFDYRGLIEKSLAIDCTNLNIY